MSQFHDKLVQISFQKPNHLQHHHELQNTPAGGGGLLKEPGERIDEEKMCKKKKKVSKMSKKLDISSLESF